MLVNVAHDKIYEKVLQRIHDKGITLNLHKMLILQREFRILRIRVLEICSPDSQIPFFRKCHKF